MVNFPGRNDRRRRVLKEEVLSATSSRTTSRSAKDSETNQTSRYSDAASVENHPQVTDFVPRRYGTVALLVLVGSGLTALAAAIHYFVLPMAAARGMSSAAALDLGARGNLIDWLAAIVLFIAAGFCLLVYSIRRHRIDDIRGRYRIWLTAALGCLVLSANSVTGLHQVVADVMGATIGWTAMREGAVWWIAAGLPLAWIFARVLLDVRECRVGGALFVGAIVCYAIAAARFFGYGPVVEARLAPILIAAPLSIGHLLVLAGIVSYARFVVLDAQGLVTVRRRIAAKKSVPAAAPKKSVSPSTQPKAASTLSLAAVETAKQVSFTVKRPGDSTQWVDGSRPERNRFDEDEDEDSSDGDRKLSKSDRKRLRKLKAQNRAA
jgi:hypothetical protein